MVFLVLFGSLYICTFWNFKLIWVAFFNLMHSFVLFGTQWFCLVLFGSVWYFLGLFGSWWRWYRETEVGFWNMFVWGTIGTVHELIARLTEQFFQHPVTKLMIFPEQPSREVHLESTTELQIIYFPSHNWQTRFSHNISWPYIWHYPCQSLSAIHPYRKYGRRKKRGKVWTSSNWPVPENMDAEETR